MLRFESVTAAGAGGGAGLSELQCERIFGPLELSFISAHSHMSDWLTNWKRSSLNPRPQSVVVVGRFCGGAPPGLAEGPQHVPGFN